MYILTHTYMYNTLQLYFFLSVGSAAFQQILRELHISEDSADDSVSSETDSAQSSTESKPKRSILKVKMMRSRKQPRKGSVKK